MLVGSARVAPAPARNRFQSRTTEQDSADYCGSLVTSERFGGHLHAPCHARRTRRIQREVSFLAPFGARKEALSGAGQLSGFGRLSESTRPPTLGKAANSEDRRSVSHRYDPCTAGCRNE